MEGGAPKHALLNLDASKLFQSMRNPDETHFFLIYIILFSVRLQSLAAALCMPNGEFEASQVYD